MTPMLKRLSTVFLGMALAISIAVAQKGDQAEVQLKAAIQKEVVDGNLKSAIEQYQKLASSSNRAVAAKALLRMGECYEKWGNTEARKAYERAVREFSDQKDVVATAQVRLAAMGSAPAGQQTTRLVWTGPKVYPDGSAVSPDGRYVSYTDWGTGNLALHDLVSGTDRPLIKTGSFKKGAYAYAEYTAISKDGKQVAYGWDEAKNKGHEIWLANVGGDLNLRRLYPDDPEGRAVLPYDWSPDGKWIAALLAGIKTQQIGLIATQDGSLRVLKSVESPASASHPPMIRFSPDGRYLAYDRVADGASRQHDVFVLALDGSRELPAVVGPAEETMVGWSPDGKFLLFTSDRTGSTGLWALPFANGTPQGNPELVKPNIGQVVPMGLTAAAALFYGVRKAPVLAHIQVATFDFGTGKLVSPPVDVAAEGAVEYNYSPDWSPDGKYLAYISRSPTGLESSIKLRSTETGQVRELRPNLYGPSGLRWAPDGRSFASPQQNGDILRVDAATGETSLLVHKLGVKGVAPWSPDGKKIYYRVADLPSSVAFVELDLASENKRELIRRAQLGGPHLSPDGRYIATGSVDPATNSNTFLLIPVAGGEPRELMRAGSGADSFSMLAWAKDSRSLLIRKRLSGENQSVEVWQALLDGSQPRKLYDLDPRVGLDQVWVHPDGRQIAFVPPQEPAAQTRSAEVWVLENFLPAAKPAK